MISFNNEIICYRLIKLKKFLGQDSFNFGVPLTNELGNGQENEAATGSLCSKDDYVGIDQGSNDGIGPGKSFFFFKKSFFLK